MKKELIIILRFILPTLILITAIDFILVYGVRNSNDSWYGKINRIANKEIDPEIMLFGPSVGEVGLDPRILQRITNYSVYNCCIDGTRYIQLKGLIDYFNSYSKKNKITILVETFFTFERISGVYELQRYLGQLKNDNIYGALYDIQPGLLWKARNVPFYKFIVANQSYYKQSFIGYKNIFGNVSTDSMKGFTPNYSNFDSFGLKSKNKFKIIVDKEILQKYINTIKDIQQKGHKVIIVLTPAFKETLNRYTNTEPLVEAFNFVSKSTGADFWDFTNSKIGNNRMNYYNVSHLNNAGAKSFSEDLSDSINKYFPKSP